ESSRPPTLGPSRRTQPPPPPGADGQGLAATPGVASRRAGTAPPATASPVPRRSSTSSSPKPASDAVAPANALFLIFNNQRISIDKDQFIIGRGSKTSDLAIKDGNISRKHAAIIRRNGTFYIKDLGSTNGIDYKGMRIDNKRIDEGDVFHLCDYELRFTYRG